MSDGHSFQFTAPQFGFPGGLAPLPMIGEPAVDAAQQALSNARVAIAAVHEGRIDKPGAMRFEGVRAYTENRGERFNVLKSARERVREIKRELRTHAALQRELAELERLLSAARGKAPAPIQIASRRAG